MSHARFFELFGFCIPASAVAGGPCETIPGRGRTAYFYRQEAISFRRMAAGAGGEFRHTCRRLALSYLKTYRVRLAGRAAVPATRPLPLP